MKNLLESIISYLYLIKLFPQLSKGLNSFIYIYEELFGFLFSFEKLKSFDDDSLQDKCLCLESALTYKNSIDINGLDLFSELKVLTEVIQTEEKKNTPVNILNYIKKLESFPNACIAYRILLTILVTVASTERTFSKLKLIKSYLRSTML